MGNNKKKNNNNNIYKSINNNITNGNKKKNKTLLSMARLKKVLRHHSVTPIAFLIVVAVLLIFVLYILSTNVNHTTNSNNPQNNPQIISSSKVYDTKSTISEKLSTIDSTANSVSTNDNENIIQPIVVSVEIINTYPHDSTSFTQGLFIHDNILYESTGLYGKSTLRSTDLTTGSIIKQHTLPSEYFAEGVTILNNLIYQLTWRENIVFVYNLDFDKVNQFHFPYEGWGITSDENNNELIISDGTNQIYFINPEKFEIKRKIPITTLNNDNKLVNVNYINELELINGFLYANIWYSNVIAKININNGNIIKIFNLNNLIQHNQNNNQNQNNNINNQEAVPNGIAFNQKNNKLYVTGKLWNYLYEIKFDQ